MRKLIFAGGALLVLSVAGPVWAGVLAATDRVSYTGTQTKYATLADAQAGINPTGGPFTIPNRVTAAPYDTPFRDAGIYFAKDAVIPYPGNTDFNYLSTAWYYSTSGGAFSGTGNPNNNDAGFIQLYDDNGSTETSLLGFFQDNLTKFTLVVSGANATNALDFTRLWNAGGEPNTGGNFINYQFSVTFGGLAGAYNPGNGMFEASNHPTSVNGTYRAVFQNTSAASSFYAVNWTFAMDNWAFGQGGSLVEGGISDSFFASNIAVPEPATATMLLPLVVLGLARRRARRLGA